MRLWPSAELAIIFLSWGRVAVAMATLVGAHNEISFEGYLLTSYVAMATATLVAIKSKVDLVADEVQVAPKWAANEFLPDFAAALHSRPLVKM